MHAASIAASAGPRAPSPTIAGVFTASGVDASRRLPRAALDHLHTQDLEAARQTTTAPCVVIFLDIDGVICTSKTGKPIIRDVLLEQLKRVVDACDAKVVLSSDWRRGEHRKEIAERKLAGKDIVCIGATPYAGQDANVRPKEIAAWLREHGRNVTRWVAIDDRLLTEEEGGDFLVGHCVMTEFATGLTAERADEAIRLLHGQQDSAVACIR